ncbi:hypothetical protein LABALGNA3A7_09550 [Dellaglioa algida]|nr:hypothetical protein LABALGNA3A7_09550 [Dellaglioa algida]
MTYERVILYYMGCVIICAIVIYLYERGTNKKIVNRIAKRGEKTADRRVKNFILYEIKKSAKCGYYEKEFLGVGEEGVWIENHQELMKKLGYNVAKNTIGVTGKINVWTISWED